MDATEEKEPIDEDVLGHNQILLQRKKRLVSELTTLENENYELCNHINELLTNTNREIFGKGRDMYSGSSSSDDEYSTRVNRNNKRVNTNYRSKRKETLMKDVEMQLPELHTGTQATEAEKRKLFTLMIRYLCIANEHQRHSVRDLYDKQSQLYLQAQGLIMAERRSHLDTLNDSSIKLAKNPESDDRFASFPDPTQISDCYEKYARNRDHASLNDSSRHSNSFQKHGNTIKSVGSLDSDTHDGGSNNNSSNPLPRLKSFRSSGKSSTSGSNHSRNSGGRRSGIFSGFLRGNTSRNANTMDTVNEVDRRARAPSIASVRKHAAITGARLVRFDNDYKQIISRRQRCPTATVVAAIANTNDLYSTLKAALAADVINPMSSEANFGFDVQYAFGRIYPFDDKWSDVNDPFLGCLPDERQKRWEEIQKLQKQREEEAKQQRINAFLAHMNRMNERNNNLNRNNNYYNNNNNHNNNNGNDDPTSALHHHSKSAAMVIDEKAEMDDVPMMTDLHASKSLHSNAIVRMGPNGNINDNHNHNHNHNHRGSSMHPKQHSTGDVSKFASRSVQTAQFHSGQSSNHLQSPRENGQFNYGNNNNNNNNDSRNIHGSQSISGYAGSMPGRTVPIKMGDVQHHHHHNNMDSPHAQSMIGMFTAQTSSVRLNDSPRSPKTPKTPTRPKTPRTPHRSNTTISHTSTVTDGGVMSPKSTKEKPKTPSGAGHKRQATATAKKKEKAVWYTLSQLVQIVTPTNGENNRMAQLMVLTHRTFCTSLEFLKELKKRYDVPIPPNITPSEIKQFKARYVVTVQSKVTAVLRYWINNHYHDDFAFDAKLRRDFNKFIHYVGSEPRTAHLGAMLTKYYTRAKRKDAVSQSIKKRVSARGGGSGLDALATKRKHNPKILAQLLDKNEDILRFTPKAIAHCIIRLDKEKFEVIEQRECFNYVKKKVDKAENLKKMINQWNSMGNWAQREILSKKRDFRARLNCIQCFVAVLGYLVEYGDFSGGYAIHSALRSIAVDRLKRYFAELTEEETQIMDEVKTLFAFRGNYPTLRNKMKGFLAKPCIPHIGVFTKDLTFLSEQDSTYKHKDPKTGELIVKFINFTKCQQLGKQISDLRMFQNNGSKWNLETDHLLLTYLRAQLQQEMKSDDDLWKLSCEVDPKSNYQ